MPPRRWIAHLDMDAFYASVELLRYPELKGQPVVIGGGSRHQPLGGVRAVAQEITNSVRRATGLSCSIGVTPNKLLSKIASELDKPDGLTIITADDIATRIWPLPARRINGIGPKAGAKLEAL